LAPVLVLITHHVEEVPPGFTDALLMREGGVVAAGALDRVMTPQNLSATFGLDLLVSRHEGRFSARAMTRRRL
jgi:iron complex transport system ATP-binding protein